MAFDLSRLEVESDSRRYVRRCLTLGLSGSRRFLHRMEAWMAMTQIRGQSPLPDQLILFPLLCRAAGHFTHPQTPASLAEAV